MSTAEVFQKDSVSSLFEANIAAFKSGAPKLYSRLSAIESPSSELVVDPEGRVDLRLRGQGFYGGDAETSTSEQLDRFFAQPLRQTINEPDAVKLEGACGDFCLAVTAHFAAEGIAYDGGHSPVESHALAIFGLGLGLHVAPLIARSGARLVLIIEPNLEFLYHSLFLVAWHELLETAEREERRIIFVTERESDAIAGRARSVLRNNNPALIDGIYLYTHYPSVVLEQAKDRIRHDLFLTLSGLGFFEDELIMTRNGVGNLCRSETAILARFHPRRAEPLFIVGSGPSVEQDLDFIAEHAERAVVISIGTGLRVLLDRGVRPDFHVELENGESIIVNIEGTSRDFDLDGITLIASVTVQPRLAAKFDRNILFFRERVTSTLLFAGPFGILQPAGPTVANTAVIAGIRMGFREMYLFGVDMGAKDKEKFHAETSVYGVGLRAEPAKPSKIHPGNFGGEVTGVAIFDWSRRVLEGVLKSHQGLTVYNCSDGVRIAGAIPKVSRAVEPTGEAIDRPALHQALRASLNAYDMERLRQAWNGPARRAEAEQAFGRLEAILERAGAATTPEMDWIHEVFDVVRPNDESGLVAGAFLSGTVSLCLGCSNWYDRRIAHPAARLQGRYILIEEFHTMLRGLKGQLAELFDDVDARIAAA